MFFRWTGIKGGKRRNVVFTLEEAEDLYRDLHWIFENRRRAQRVQRAFEKVRDMPFSPKLQRALDSLADQSAAQSKKLLTVLTTTKKGS